MYKQEVDHWTSIQNVRESTKRKLTKLKEHYNLSYGGMIEHMINNDDEYINIAGR